MLANGCEAQARAAPPLQAELAEFNVVFESENAVFPAFERNGQHIRENLQWDFIDETNKHGK